MTDQIFAIKSWITGGVLFETTATDMRAAVEEAVRNGANLRGADLRGTDLRGTDLRGANLRGADLNSADLRGANLRGADLNSADLRGTDLRGTDLSYSNLSGSNLRGADLSGSTGIEPWIANPLMMLLDQPGPIRAYKLVDAEYRSPIQTKGKIKYAIDAEFSVADADANVNQGCGAGINLATFDWCAREWREGWRVLVAEFTAADIAAIPIASDGKFRVHRCRVVGEVTDLAARGFPAAAVSK